jgi:hypothetical protein
MNLRKLKALLYEPFQQSDEAMHQVIVGLDREAK